MNSFFYLIVILVLVGVFYAGYRLFLLLQPKTFCPKCGGEMTPNAQKYRYTIEWTCGECGETFEQLRNK